jgi:hypothetical protein
MHQRVILVVGWDWRNYATLLASRQASTPSTAPAAQRANCCL